MNQDELKSMPDWLLSSLCCRYTKLSLEAVTLVSDLSSLLEEALTWIDKEEGKKIIITKWRKATKERLALVQEIAEHIAFDIEEQARKAKK